MSQVQDKYKGGGPFFKTRFRCLFTISVVTSALLLSAVWKTVKKFYWFYWLVGGGWGGGGGRTLSVEITITYYLETRFIHNLIVTALLLSADLLMRMRTYRTAHAQFPKVVHFCAHFPFCFTNLVGDQICPHKAISKSAHFEISLFSGDFPKKLRDALQGRSVVTSCQ